MGTTITAVDPSLPTVVAATPDLPFRPGATPAAELGRQVEVYLALGFAHLLGTDEAGFRSMLTPTLAAAEEPGAVPGAAPDGLDPSDHVPVLLVLPTVALNDAAPAMRRGDRRGVSVIDPVEAARYRPVPRDVPAGPAYLVVGIDTGSEFRSVPPAEALVTVQSRRRTPLTVAEGVALTVVRPDMLRPNRCFSLMGSRAGDRRVPAVWISERRAKLGWCWDGNPHTWLGAASAARRLGPPGS
ncbi:MAG TPA: DUF5701 family protein [Actinotalea sp.]|nr:DUF5701 family protein [Actinotalea sp.]